MCARHVHKMCIYLHVGHVHAVHIAALLLVHFDVDKAVVHELGYGLALKALPLHHMAPAVAHDALESTAFR